MRGASARTSQSVLAPSAISARGGVRFERSSSRSRHLPLRTLARRATQRVPGMAGVRASFPERSSPQALPAEDMLSVSGCSP